MIHTVQDRDIALRPPSSRPNAVLSLRQSTIDYLQRQDPVRIADEEIVDDDEEEVAVSDGDEAASDAAEDEDDASLLSTPPTRGTRTRGIRSVAVKRRLEARFEDEAAASSSRPSKRRSIPQVPRCFQDSPTLW